MKQPHVLIGALFLAVFVVGLLSERWFDAPDYQALCQAECACTGCAVLDCVDAYEQRGEEQGECREAGDAIAACKLKQGGATCERGGGWTLYMPTEMCRPELDAFGACLETRGDRGQAKAEEVFEASRPAVSFAEAMRVMCDAPNHVDVEDLPPSERASAWAKYIETHAKNAEFERFLRTSAAMPAAQRDAAMRDAVTRAGIEECAMLSAMPPAQADTSAP